MNRETHHAGDFFPLETLPHIVSRETKNKIEKYIALVWEWNQKTNLTGAKSPDDFCLHHVFDCIAAWGVLNPQPVYLDVGSGAGLPGIVWGVLSPQTKIFLIEANQKKAAFLQRAVSLFELTNLKVIPKRFEEVGGDLISQCRRNPPKIVSRGTRAPKKLWPTILASPVPFTEWLVFSSTKTHLEFLTLAKNSDMEITSLPYSRDLEEEKSIGQLTRIKPRKRA